jgi:DNA-binding response OmpR family regulator
VKIDEKGGKMARKKGVKLKKILVIDDEENIRLLYQEELKENGYEVILASNGQEGIEKFDCHNPDLVTLDIRMSDLNGLDTLKQIRDRSRDVPIILCTAYEEYKQDLRSWGSDAYVVKSSDLNEFLTKIKEILR